MEILNLNGIWNVKGISPTGETIAFEGMVPGCVHTDLYRENVIPDPLYRDNFKKCQWIENYNWIYSSVFNYSLKYNEDVYIKFECLDVECDIFLNDVKIGSADNMFIDHTFYIGNVLKSGKNEIRVVFYAHTKRTRAMPQLYGAFNKERLHKRRMQCTYGWDFVERFVTCGIEKDVTLITKEKCEIDNVYVFTQSADADTAQIVVDTQFTSECANIYAEYTICDSDSRVVFEKNLLLLRTVSIKILRLKNHKCGIRTVMEKVLFMSCQLDL